MPGLIDIFYNGSKLDNSEYTANNGTFFTLATASLAGDKLEVDVYSYQVGAFSGIGGAAAATQVAYFDSTNSITGSPNFTISGSTMTVTGSLTVSGSGTFTNIGPAIFSGSITSTDGFTGSFSGTATNATSASYASSATSASYALSTTSASYALTSTSASYALNTTSASYALSSSFAYQAQTASSADAFTVRNTLTAQTLVVQTVTSSIVYSSGSNIFGNALANTQTFTGSVLITGSIGIGTSPTTVFDIASSTSPSLLVTMTGDPTNQGTMGAIRFVGKRSTYGTSFMVGIEGYQDGGTGDYNGLRFITSAGSQIERMRITSDGKIGIGTTTPSTTLHVSGSPDTLGRVARFNTSYTSASINIAHSGNGGNIGFANIGSGDLSNVFFVSTGGGTIGSGIVVNNSGGTGFATSNVSESVQATGTISIIPNSSVSSGPLIQFAGNGRIRPASSGDRLSIDGNALYLNSFVGGNIIANTAGGGFSIGRSDAPSKLNISGSNDGSTPLVDLRVSGDGQWQRGVRLINANMSGGSSVMYAVGQADSARNMGQFYFYYAGAASTNNRLGFGLHSVDNVMSIQGSGVVTIGTTTNYSDTMLSVMGVTSDTSTYSFIAKNSTPRDLLLVRNDGWTVISANKTSEALQVNNIRNGGSGDYALVTTLGSSDNNTSNYHYIAATGGADKYYLYGNGTYTTVSDARLKKNITTVTDTYLDKINALRVVNYNWNDQQDGSPLELGMIAQEVEALIPSIVHEGREHEDGNVYKGIQVSTLPYILIKAIQELKAQNDDLQSQINELKNK